MACEWVAAVMDAVVEAHEFGICEGPHRQPWTESFLCDAVEVCAETLPVWYLREVASLFEQAVEALEARRIPAHQAEDWLIVIQHMRNAHGALAQRGAPNRESPGSRPGVWPEAASRVPRILRVDRLAALTTTEGARRLAGAAAAVCLQLADVSEMTLTAEQRRLLRAVASGAAVADLAEEFGYSRRSMYRHLSRLWKHLGVSGPIQGMCKATAEGLLD